MIAALFALAAPVETGNTVRYFFGSR